MLIVCMLVCYHFDRMSAVLYIVGGVSMYVSAINFAISGNNKIISGLFMYCFVFCLDVSRYLIIAHKKADQLLFLFHLLSSK